MNAEIKEMPMRHFTILATVTATIGWPATFVLAQSPADYPSKPVRIIAAAGVGGGADVIGRIFAQKLSDNLKSQFVVENRPGGGDTIGIALAAKSAPDGYTLMVATPSLTIAPALYSNFSVEPLRDFVPISLTNKAPYLLVVHPSLPVKSAKDLIALAKTKPGAMNIGITVGGTQHLATAYLISMANIKITTVPYTLAGQIMTDTMGGQIHGYVLPVQTTLPVVKSGRLRALGVTTAERTPVLPDLPTISESGVPGYDVSGWYGWIAPAGTPAAVVGKLNAELIRALRSPDVAKRMADDGAVIVGNTPEQFGQLIAAEVTRWRTVVKDLAIRVE